MAKTRQSKVIITDITREEAEDAFAEFAAADARAQQITAKMDVEMTRIREKYADELQKLEDVKDASFEKLQCYGESNRDEFGKKKSLDMVHGVIGFRTGTPKLKLLGGYKWESVTTLVKALLPAYIRTTEEVAKDQLLADRELLVADFPKVGIKVDQDEKFFVEPKKEEIAA